MSQDHEHASLIADAVDLAVQIRRDTDRPEAELHRRDRVFFGTRAGTSDDRAGVVRHWLARLREAGRPLPGLQVQKFCRGQTALLTIIGLLAGWGTAGAVFAYDGSRPVNVVHVLSVFVGLQAVLLAGLGVVLLPAWMTRRLPLLGGLQELLLALSPGRWVSWARRWLPERTRRALDELPAFTGVRRDPLGLAAKWWIIRSAQACGVAFYAGALATLLYWVVFSDMAFAWSTTLKTDAVAVQRLTDTLSAPWAAWLPSAVPSKDLIDETQHYRSPEAVTTKEPPIPPGRWGEWWPFIVSVMVVYGFMPRAVLWTLAALRFRFALQHVFTDTDGAALVWDRLNAAVVTTQAAEEDPQTAGEAAAERGEPSVALPAAKEFMVVNWGGLDLEEDALRSHLVRLWNARAALVVHAGGRASVEADANVIEAATGLPPSIGVVVFVKAWEPPVLEVLDFLRELCSAVGSSRLVLVCPVGWSTDGSPEAPTEAQAQQWGKKVRSIGRGAPAVRPWPGGVAS